MNRPPYFGITGFTRRDQVSVLLDCVHGTILPPDRKVMAGVLVSWKSLTGFSPDDPSNPNQFPPIEEVDLIWQRDGVFLNLVHYNTREPNLYAQLALLFERLSDTCHGVQLNLAWPVPEILRRLRQNYGKTIVLQVGGAAYQVAGRTAGALVEQLRPYEGLIDYALLDPSGGLGRGFDDDFAAVNLEALVNSGLDISWGMAGGLAAANLSQKIPPLLEIDPHLSWDAQGRLRTSKDQLDLEACRAYLEASADLVRSAASGN